MRGGAWFVLLLVAFVKIVFAVLLRSRGLTAISDDDFARTLIAERFVAAPSWDPSGTSWLPFPFWLSGTSMMLFGRSIEVARTTAVCVGIVATWLVLAAGAALGLSRSGRLAAALLACSIPWFAWSSVTTTPEALTAALLVFGVATLSCADLRLRSAGALALTLAALSRYEAWPVAGVFALFTGMDGCRVRRPAYAAPAALALLGPLCWLVHGAIHHGSATFFVSRVVAYRKAIGGDASVWERLLTYPRLLLEPGALIGLTAVSIFASLRLDPAAKRAVTRFGRPALALLALLLFLIVGEVRDGAPTHHAERTLLPIWIVIAIASAELLARTARAARAAAVRFGVAAAGLLTALALTRDALLLRGRGFADREPEVQIGRTASAIVEDEARMTALSADFGYFAVLAAFARPESSAPWVDNDPRRPRPLDPLRSPEAARGSLREQRARYFVVPLERATAGAGIGIERARNGRFALFQVTD